MAQITLHDYLQETEDAISSQRVDEALAHCQYMLAYFPESLEAQRLLGEVYLAQGRLEDARQAFDWVLINDPENVVVYCSRALVSEKMTDYDTALDCYQQAYELSRGNSQIRLAFNQLSAKTGQQGFMLSRAGLARLYMRGDLFSQAIQEWDVVLASTPDRVDARLGLLETYWREGLYDRVLPLANQILQDVPACEKALLLLAHVTAPQDMLQSRELVKRAQTLDPDLVMAQDLFSDLLANHAGDPFLKLLKIEPAIFATRVTDPGSSRASASSVKEDSRTSRSSSALADWNDEQAGSETTLAKPRPPVEEEKTALPWQNGAWGDASGSFAGNGNADLAGSASAPGSAGSLWGALDEVSQAGIGGVDEPEPWSLLQDALTRLPSEFAQGQLQSSSLLPSDSLSSPDNSLAAPSSASLFSQEGNQGFSSDYSGVDQWGSAGGDSSTPAWLSMLTQQAEQEQEVVAETSAPPELPVSPPVSRHEEEVADLPPTEVSPVSAPQLPEPQSEVASDRPSSIPEPEEPVFALNDDDESEEESLFGPDWLKSLGATTLDGGTGEVPVVKAAAESESSVQRLPDRQVDSNKPANFLVSEPVVEKTTRALPDLQKEAGSTGRSWLDELSVESSNPPVRQESPVEKATPVREEFAASAQSAASDVWGRSANIPEFETGYTEASNGEYRPPVADSFEYNGWSNPAGQPSWLEQMTADAASEPMASSPVFSADAERTERDEVEQHVVSTLEELEQNLLSSGFIPLEPNSLANLAKGQEEASVSSYSFGPGSMQEESYASSSEAYQNPPLSTAFAELSGSAPFNEPYRTAQPEQGFAAASAYVSSESAQKVPSHELPSPQDTRLEEEKPGETHQQSEPAWLAALRAMPAQPGPSSSPQPVVDQPQLMAQNTGGIPLLPQPAINPSRLVAQSSGKMPTAPQPAVNQARVAAQNSEKMPTTPQPAVNQARVMAQNTGAIPVSRRPAFEIPPQAQEKTPRMPVEASPSSMNPLLGSELETTMKRPAVRLQPVQQRINVPREQSPSRPNIPEPAPLATPPAVVGRSNNRVADDQLSHQDRLVKGYQSQLIGDYDTAMQEYRIIIRNAPELLGEVVSNMRALLKLAPKYSAGYRVLGDAYMRQGEYLQAMEAYNKALAMAKKAKS